MRRTFLFLVFLCVTLIGCQRQESATPAGGNTATSWAATRDALIEEFLEAQPAFAVYQGRHEFDGRLPDWSTEGIAAG